MTPGPISAEVGEHRTDVRETDKRPTILRARDAWLPDIPGGAEFPVARGGRCSQTGQKNPCGGPNYLRTASVERMDIDQPQPTTAGSSLAGGGPRDSAGSSLSRQHDRLEPSDEDLLQRFCSSEDGRAYESLVRRYEQELFSYLRRYLGNAEMAEDVFQATFLQVYLKRERFEQGRRFRPWLYTIATNQAIDAQRRNRRHRMVSLDQKTSDDEVGGLMEIVSADGPTAVEQLEDEEAREWVRAAVDDLPETLRAALVLVYHQGMKYREAADVLGIPVGTVKSRLHAALLKLNQSWATAGNSEPTP